MTMPACRSAGARHREGIATEYAADGTRILDRDAAGQPLHTQPVLYRLARGPDGAFTVEELSADAF